MSRVTFFYSYLLEQVTFLLAACQVAVHSCANARDKAAEVRVAPTSFALTRVQFSNQMLVLGRPVDIANLLSFHTADICIILMLITVRGFLLCWDT